MTTEATGHRLEMGCVWRKIRVVEIFQGFSSSIKTYTFPQKFITTAKVNNNSNNNYDHVYGAVIMT